MGRDLLEAECRLRGADEALWARPSRIPALPELSSPGRLTGSSLTAVDAAGRAETPPLTFLTSHFESEKSQGAPRCQQFSQTLRRLTRDPGALCVFGGDTNLRCVQYPPSLAPRLGSLSDSLADSIWPGDGRPTHARV